VGRGDRRGEAMPVAVVAGETAVREQGRRARPRRGPSHRRSATARRAATRGPHGGLDWRAREAAAGVG